MPVCELCQDWQLPDDLCRGGFAPMFKDSGWNRNDWSYWDNENIWVFSQTVLAGLDSNILLASDDGAETEAILQVMKGLLDTLTMLNYTLPGH